VALRFTNSICQIKIAILDCQSQEQKHTDQRKKNIKNLMVIAKKRIKKITTISLNLRKIEIYITLQAKEKYSAVNKCTESHRITNTMSKLSLMLVTNQDLQNCTRIHLQTQSLNLAGLRMVRAERCAFASTHNDFVRHCLCEP